MDADAAETWRSRWNLATRNHVVILADASRNPNPMTSDAHVLLRSSNITRDQNTCLDSHSDRLNSPVGIVAALYHSITAAGPSSLSSFLALLALLIARLCCFFYPRLRYLHCFVYYMKSFPPSSIRANSSLDSYMCPSGRCILYKCCTGLLTH